MNTGESIKYWRESKSLTQKQLAEASGLSEISIRKYEANDRAPKIKNIFAIAGALGISPFELISAEEYNNEINKEVYDKLQEEIKSSEFHADDKKEQLLLDNFFLLNETGQEKAIEQVELLTRIPEYKAKIETFETQLKLDKDGNLTD